MNKILLIVAAGKASRFGGFPKAFAHINGMANIENTMQQVAKIYDRVYVAVNKETFETYKDKLQGCEMFDIITGNGEAHSLLKGLRYVRKREPEIERITVCWGDAYFLNQTPFKEALEYEKKEASDRAVIVFCALDRKPYAWFDVEKGYIKRSHFAREGQPVDDGIHDQSLFMFNIKEAIKYLNQYKEKLGIPEEYTDGREMRLLKSFEFLYESSEYQPAKCVMIQGNNVFSFNTKEEVEEIEKMIKVQNDRGENIC